MILKCKMCGGDLHVQEGMTTCVCEYCLSTQTIPQVDDERISQMYNLANRRRMLKDFDKAQMEYESIALEKPEDAEAYWGAVLCRFGIEDVEDPITSERKPTMHRMQFDSILEDNNYKLAMEKADPMARKLYEREARKIDYIQKEYLAISAKEQPFDVFICYKETEIGSNARTSDSVYAQEIYEALTQRDYKVFFSRITLEDKLGENYEPYIFAALNSAKVMLVVGTSTDKINSEWVQNEWRCFLFLMRKDTSKKLIPVYRDMDAYDMPEEFVHLQSQDYSKISALQDLICGVEKIIGKKKGSYQQSTSGSGPTVDSLLQHGFIAIETGAYDEAANSFDKVLDIDPQNGRAYLGKMMANLHVQHEDDLAHQAQPFDNNSDYQRMLRFCDEATISKMRKINQFIRDRNTFSKAQSMLNDIRVFDSVDQCIQVFDLLQSIPDYQYTNNLVTACHNKIDTLVEDGYHQVQDFFSERIFQANRYHRVKSVMALIAKLSVYSEKAEQCVNLLFDEMFKYAQSIVKQGDYENAVIILDELSCYEHQVDKHSGFLKYQFELKYLYALLLEESGDYAKAAQLFQQLGDYQDSPQHTSICLERNFSDYQ